MNIHEWHTMRQLIMSYKDKVEEAGIRSTARDQAPMFDPETGRPVERKANQTQTVCRRDGPRATGQVQALIQRKLRIILRSAHTCSLSTYL